MESSNTSSEPQGETPPGFFSRLFRRRSRKRLKVRVSDHETRIRRLEIRMENTNALAASLGRDIERMQKAGTAPLSAHDKGPEPVIACPPESGAQLYRAFENEFRGDRETILKRQAEYIPFILDAARACPGKSILDVGCGRGEFLQLLRENHVESRGVDIDAAMIEQCRAQKFDVEKDECLSVLRRGEDGDLAGVVAFQVVEHIGYESIVELIKLSHARIAPGGVLILETVNPASFTALRAFYLDPTHRNPLPAATLEFLVRTCGFREVSVRYTSPMSPKECLRGHDRNTAMLNALLFGPRDYAVIGWR